MIFSKKSSLLVACATALALVVQSGQSDLTHQSGSVSPDLERSFIVQGDSLLKVQAQLAEQEKTQQQR